MEKEYIEKQAVEDMIENAHLIPEGEYCGYCTEDIDINSIPVADVAPVRHGRWAHLGGDEWCCTNCGNVINTEGSWEQPYQKYCDECGAKMDLED